MNSLDPHNVPCLCGRPEGESSDAGSGGRSAAEEQNTPREELAEPAAPADEGQPPLPGLCAECGFVSALLEKKNCRDQGLDTKDHSVS